MTNQESKFDALTREGWTRQFVASEPRLSEAVALYKETGYEVHLEPVPEKNQASDILPMMGSECTSCFEGSEDQYKIIFTRPKKGSLFPDSDSFE